jgi:hypothetical protein
LFNDAGQWTRNFLFFLPTIFSFFYFYHLFLSLMSSSTWINQIVLCRRIGLFLSNLNSDTLVHILVLSIHYAVLCQAILIVFILILSANFEFQLLKNLHF